MLVARGRLAGSILVTGPIITICQAGRAGGQCRDQRQIHPFVDDAAEAEPGVGDAGLVRRLGEGGAGGREMCGVDGGRERRDGRVAMALGFVQAVAAGEHHIRTADQFGFPRHQQRIGMGEGGKLVHAVIDTLPGAQMIREAQHHRRVVPQDRGGRDRGCHQRIQQHAQAGLPRRAIPPVRQAGAQGR